MTPVPFAMPKQLFHPPRDSHSAARSGSAINIVTVPFERPGGVLALILAARSGVQCVGMCVRTIPAIGQTFVTIFMPSSAAWAA